MRLFIGQDAVAPGRRRRSRRARRRSSPRRRCSPCAPVCLCTPRRFPAGGPGSVGVVGGRVAGREAAASLRAPEPPLPYALELELELTWPGAVRTCPVVLPACPGAVPALPGLVPTWPGAVSERPVLAHGVLAVWPRRRLLAGRLQPFGARGRHSRWGGARGRAGARAIVARLVGSGTNSSSWRRRSSPRRQPCRRPPQRQWPRRPRA
jgi:hypothetical protein